MLACVSAVFGLLSALRARLKGGVECVEVLAVQMLLGTTEGITEATVSNKCCFCLVVKGLFAVLHF